MKKLIITVLGKSYEVLVEDMGEVTNEPSAYAEHIIPPSVPVAPVERNTAVTVSAPMCGTVIEITTSVGAEVGAGTPLLTLEAMKMQNVIPAPKDGKVREILVRKGDTVSTGAPMFIID
ncbi:MAG: acetyl-CoA carboxylase biotin carboxyl carrier protein subunit [Ruminococcaceae bacterium]|nr:acetyl-CoA carboxylase biotin carboxyl carrier protein subunit [Oscillospiraceae bacterium]